MLLQIQCFSSKGIPKERSIVDHLNQQIILGVEKSPIGTLMEASGNG